MKTNEKLAEYIHDAWSRWMKYLFDQCIETGDDCYEIQTVEAENWIRQMNSKYNDLSKEEKDIFRQESGKVLKIFIGEDEDE